MLSSKAVEYDVQPSRRTVQRNFSFTIKRSHPCNHQVFKSYRQERSPIESTVIHPQPKFVYLRVYNLLSDELPLLDTVLSRCCRVGIHHSSVLIGDKEWFFSDGIQYQHHQSHPGRLIYSAPIGQCTLTDIEIYDIVKKLRLKYNRGSYHIIRRNCNHFTEDFLNIICGQQLPKWVTKAERLVHYIPGLVNIINKYSQTTALGRIDDSKCMEKRGTSVKYV
ncbi:hypothetical protein ACOME3_000478 [Neoechinorhynchus agilis]